MQALQRLTFFQVLKYDVYIYWFKLLFFSSPFIFPVMISSSADVVIAFFVCVTDIKVQGGSCGWSNYENGWRHASSCTLGSYVCSWGIIMYAVEELSRYLYPELQNLSSKSSACFNKSYGWLQWFQNPGTLLFFFSCFESPTTTPTYSPALFFVSYFAHHLLLMLQVVLVMVFSDCKTGVLTGKNNWCWSSQWQEN